MITIGLDVFLDTQTSLLKGERLGLLTNQASVNRHLIHDRILLQHKFGKRLTTLFSPQHGFYSEQQDNMIESDHITDGDLRRHMDGLLDLTADDVQTNGPTTVRSGALAEEALGIMNAKKITCLFVCDEAGHIEGLLHIHDCLRAGLG